ncbi:NlpC/P60 family putative phage cell wall peptidase [Phyllobacterium sp. 1468]|uniref:NlpC/P60 family protein n=1 Tax=Phyllobacterium sp. 1468 TaxID=2817759 RepID=UPI00285D3196|nr:NlpC/P60 family protein [Phyllobacterium sp. 1468]MDR6633767.1 NlpC/P60 family putative phage cell wall peptidase [Phyllobacterium sp. 1468]
MSIAEEVLSEAWRWIGTPYRHGGSRCTVGCDCLGLVRGIWRALYGQEPQLVPVYSMDWAESSTADPLLDAARLHMTEKTVNGAEPGDLLVFRWRDGVAAKHLGILADQGRFIHAYEGHSVVGSALVPQWRKRIAGVFAFPDRNAAVRRSTSSP